MSIQEIRDKINTFVADDTVFTALLIILVAITSFGLGRQSSISLEPSYAVTGEVPKKQEIRLEQTVSERESAAVKTTEEDAYTYVASKNSNKYHLPWCSGAKNIAEANKIYFSSKEEASAAGYSPAGNCKGI